MTTATDASASHNVDPLPPTGFRLFGLGGKKKDEEKAAKPEPSLFWSRLMLPAVG